MITIWDLPAAGALAACGGSAGTVMEIDIL
jgi:hypothetical protein